VRIAPTYGGINLEDISAPRCFEIERRLQDWLEIPVFHDDQHGTAIVTLAGLINAAKVVGRPLQSLRVVISGAGAAGVAVCRLLARAGVADLVVCDSRGIISPARTDLGEQPHKRRLAATTNPRGLSGSLGEALVRQLTVLSGYCVRHDAEGTYPVGPAISRSRGGRLPLYGSGSASADAPSLRCSNPCGRRS
jgi:malic enzyme